MMMDNFENRKPRHSRVEAFQIYHGLAARSLSFDVNDRRHATTLCSSVSKVHASALCLEFSMAGHNESDSHVKYSNTDRIAARTL